MRTDCFARVEDLEPPVGGRVRYYVAADARAKRGRAYPAIPAIADIRELHRGTDRGFKSAPYVWGKIIVVVVRLSYFGC